MGLALWLLPSSSQARLRIEEQIRSLSSPLLSPPLSAPASAPFSAHATLISGLEVKEGEDEAGIWNVAIEGIREWQSSHREGGKGEEGIGCRLREVTTRGSYFQCLLLALSLPPSLAHLNNIMRTRFGKESQPPYFPHISLLYADIPAEEARRHIARLEKEGWFERVGSAASRVEGPKEEHGKGGEEAVRVKDVGGEVSFDEVQLWDCNGPVAGWKKLRSMSLVEER